MANTPEIAQDWLEQIFHETHQYRLQRIKNWEIRHNVDTLERNDDGTQFPWDGAPDHKIFYVDGIIRRQKALWVQAVEKGQIFSQPQETADVELARAGEDILTYYWNRIPNRRREVELTADRVLEKGSGILGVFWDQKLQAARILLKRNELPPEIQLGLGVTPEAVGLDSGEDQVIALRQKMTRAVVARWLMTNRGVSEEDVLDTIDELISKEEAEYTKIEQRDVGLHLRSYILYEDFYMAHPGQPIENQPWLALVYETTQEQLMAKVAEGRFERSVAEAVVQATQGQRTHSEFEEFFHKQERDIFFGVSSSARRAQQFLDQDGKKRAQNILLIDFFYEDDQDGDLIPEKYLMTYSPAFLNEKLNKKKFEPFSYPHGNWPFVDFHRETIDDRTAASRGVPQISGSIQESKRINYNVADGMAQLRIAPPMLSPVGRAIRGQFSPFGQMFYRGDRNQFAPINMPANDVGWIELSNVLSSEDKQYWGEVRRDMSNINVGDKETAFRARVEAGQGEVQAEFDMSNFTSSMTKVIQQCWTLIQAFAPPEISFRVLNDPTLPPIKRNRNDIQGRWDVIFHVDALTFDRAGKEAAELEILNMVLARQPRNINQDEVIKQFILSRDRVLGRRIMQAPQVPDEKELEDEMNWLARMLSGADLSEEGENIRLDANPQTRLQILQIWSQKPESQQILQANEQKRAKFDRRVQQYQFQTQQQQNALIGRFGA